MCHFANYLASRLRRSLSQNVLNRSDPFANQCVILISISGVMEASVTVRADGSHTIYLTGSTVCDSVDVMNFEEWHTRCCREGRGAAARFTHSAGASQR